MDVSCHELKEEIESKRISTSPLIESLIREAEERSVAYQRQEEEINRPLPREESLGAFFEDLQIGNFIIGSGIGGYGMDWGHIELSNLDKIAKQASLSKHCPDGHRLEHTTKGPYTRIVKGSGITMYTTSFGEIEQPWFVAKDGTHYTFLFAKFREGYFHVRVAITRPGNEEVLKEEHTLVELRAMIGELPPRPVMKSGLLSRFASLIGL